MPYFNRLKTESGIATEIKQFSGEAFNIFA